MNQIVNSSLDQLFLKARTYNSWQNRAVSDEQIQQLYNLVKMAPTSANCSPARFIFIRSEQAKEKLKVTLSSGNLEKTMTAPVTVLGMPRLVRSLSCHTWQTPADPPALRALIQIKGHASRIDMQVVIELTSAGPKRGNTMNAQKTTPHLSMVANSSTYEAAFHDHIASLHAEGRYRVFADIKRQRGSRSLRCGKLFELL